MKRSMLGRTLTLSLLPVALALLAGTVAWRTVLSLGEVPWRPLGSPPSGAVRFLPFSDQPLAVENSAGDRYYLTAGDWELLHLPEPSSPYSRDKSCYHQVTLPRETVALRRDCTGYGDAYYVILEDGSVWTYQTGGDDNYRMFRALAEFVATTGAGVAGFGVGAVAIVLCRVARSVRRKRYEAHASKTEVIDKGTQATLIAEAPPEDAAAAEKLIPFPETIRGKLILVLATFVVALVLTGFIVGVNFLYGGLVILVFPAGLLWLIPKPMQEWIWGPGVVGSGAAGNVMNAIGPFL